MYQRQRILQRQRRHSIPYSNGPAANDREAGTEQPPVAKAHSSSAFNLQSIGVLPGPAAVGAQGGDLSRDTAAQILASRGAGVALDTTTQARMGAQFGHAFDDVRVHADRESDQLSHAVDAQAFTVGQDIFLSHEAASAGPYGGDRLLAHELTHVVQQRGAAQNGALTVTPEGDAQEHEANRIADQIGGSRATPIHGTSSLGVSPLRIQRDRTKSKKPAPTVASLAQDVDALKAEQSVLQKQQKAVQLDLEWRAKFGQKFASYKQAVWRISGGIEAANKGFQEAQVAQAQTDAMMTQLFMLGVSVVFAFGFEPLATMGLGKLGTSAAKTKDIVELLENPLNSLVGATAGNVVPTYLQGKRAEKAQVPTINGSASAMSFLATQSESLEKHIGDIEGAFAKRAATMKTMDAQAWAAFDVDAQAKIYQQLMSDLETAAKGVEDLKEPQKLAEVLERHLWAAWIRGEHHLMLTAVGQMTNSSPEELEKENPDALANPGSDINARLIKLGVEGAAGVGLSTHWYERNSDDWEKNLMKWAKTYNDSVAK